MFFRLCVSCEPSLVDAFRTHEIIIAVLAVVALVCNSSVNSEQGVQLISSLIDIFKFAVLLALFICCIIASRR